MTLITLKKKKSEIKRPSSCTCGCQMDSGKNLSAEPTHEANGRISCIKVLGSGCATCHKLFENVKEAVNEMGLSADIEYITDMAKVMEYGVMSMPALVFDEKVISMGKLLKASEIIKLLGKLN